jgi:hypothetical protein
MRSSYWNIGNFADSLRGTKKLELGTSKEWREWEKAAKAAHPFRYHLVEEFIPSVQRILSLPYDKVMDIKYTMLNKYVSKTHALTANPKHIKPGSWCDLSERVLFCLFDELVEFVEVESAWKEVAFNSEDREKYNVPRWGLGIFRTRTWRSPEAGMSNLKWQSELKFDEDYCKGETYYMEYTPQAKAAQEIIALYNWWTIDYPKRVEPMEASGWSEYCELVRSKTGCIFDVVDQEDAQLREMSATAHKRLCEIEEQYHLEDESMLIRLVKVRKSLWT